MRFEDAVNDVKDWVELLSKDKRFNKIIIAGHSEGSHIGILAATDNKKVNTLISIAGAGRPLDVIIKEQLADIPNKDVLNTIYAIIDTLKKDSLMPGVPPIFYDLFRPSIQPYMISWFNHDPETEIKNLEIPILILQGTTDVQVKVIDAENLAKAKPEAELKIIKNMNHVLKDCDTMDKKLQEPIYASPDLPLNKEFVSAMVDFLKKLK